jgi:hypothetical protein
MTVKRRQRPPRMAHRWHDEGSAGTTPELRPSRDRPPRRMNRLTSHPWQLLPCWGDWSPQHGRAVCWVTDLWLFFAVGDGLANASAVLLS